MRVVCKEQRTAEWHAARLGKVTASNIAKALHYVDKGSVKRGDKRRESAADRSQYIRDIAWELITGIPTEHYVSKPMEIGSQYEGEARTEYWQAFGEEVEETGFVLHPTLDCLGCSPDGLLIGRGIEIKVPLLKTHENYIVDDVVPLDYIDQMQCNMLCCEMNEWIFVSYVPAAVYPDFPDELRLFTKPLKADLELHRQMEDAAVAAIEEANELVTLIRSRYPHLGPPKEYRPPLPPIAEYDPDKSFAENCAFLSGQEIVP